jgi:TIGR03009 family protein
MRRIVLLAGPWIAAAALVGSARGQATDRGQAPARRSLPASAPATKGSEPEAAQIPASDAPAPLDPRVAAQRMEQLLKLWEQQSVKVDTLDAQFIREDYDAQWKERTRFLGRAILKNPNLAFLDFKRIEDNNLVPFEQIRCTGNEVYHYVNSSNQIYIYQLAPQEKQRALEEGPLPFMFNMRAEEAKRRYKMTLLSETPTYYRIAIEPKEDIDREAFLSADVLLDKERFLPNALQLTGTNGKDKKTFWFTGQKNYIKTNVEVNAVNFQGRVLKGWSIVRPDADGKVAGPAQAPGRPAPQPVQRQSQTKPRSGLRDRPR